MYFGWTMVGMIRLVEGKERVWFGKDCRRLGWWLGRGRASKWSGTDRVVRLVGSYRKVL